MCFISIFIGLAIIFYPHIKNAMYENRQLEVLEIISTKEKIDLQANEISATENELEESNNIDSQVELSSLDSQVEENDKVQSEIESEAVGIIKIEKIELELPLLEGATNSNLKIGPSILKESTPFGKVGNISIAGHRSYTFGKQFNRLDELEIGDEIEVLKDKKKYIYIINKKFIVDPEDVWILGGNGEDELITLITCTPIKVATHRLIVQGKIR
jgi:sortase A